MSAEAPKMLPQTQRTITDELRELQYITDQFKNQLKQPLGVAGLHPLGSIDNEKAQQAFTASCQRLRQALIGYRDTTLVSWGRLLSTDTQALQQATHGGILPGTTAAATVRSTAATLELGEMRHITDTLHEDAKKCSRVLFDAAGEAVSQALLQSNAPGQSGILVERLKACAKKLGLAHYEDVQETESGGQTTTVTLAGSILVIDVDIGQTSDQLRVKISYVSDIEHESRMDTLLLSKLALGDIHAFEKLLEQMALLDRLTKDHAPANFIHNTFALVATFAEIQTQELKVLGGDVRQLLVSGSGIALPYTSHIGPSTLYHLPAVIKSGLSSEDWDSLGANTLENVSDIQGLHWIHYGWEPARTQHCLLSALFQKHCLSPDDSLIEDPETHYVVDMDHPGIKDLKLRFLQFRHQPSTLNNSDAMQVDSDVPKKKDVEDEFWIPFKIVGRLDKPIAACALTVRRILAATAVSTETSGQTGATSDDTIVDNSSLDSPRLLEDAPTLENLVYQETLANTKTNNLGVSSTDYLHCIEDKSIKVYMESPQIRAWTIYRIPLNHPGNILTIVPLLRRQAVFNELVGSCFTTNHQNSLSNDGVDKVSNSIIRTKTFANDPFRIDILVKHGDESDMENGKRARVQESENRNTEESTKQSDVFTSTEAEQGIVLRVVESTGDILVWTHQALNVTVSGNTNEMFAALGAVQTSSLVQQLAHTQLSTVANISHSIPMIAFWLASNPL